MIVFFIGLSLMALLIGLLTGLSTSSVVPTLLPLLFALATAGGNIYVIMGQKEKKSDNDKPIPTEINQRARFIGFQLAMFAVFFSLGAWSGVYSKYNVDKIWFKEGVSTSVYQEFIGGNLEVFYVLRNIDQALANDGVDEEKRREIIEALHDEKDKWGEKEISDNVLSFNNAGTFDAQKDPALCSPRESKSGG